MAPEVGQPLAARPGRRQDAGLKPWVGRCPLNPWARYDTTRGSAGELLGVGSSSPFFPAAYWLIAATTRDVSARSESTGLAPASRSSLIVERPVATPRQRTSATCAAAASLTESAT